ncbi:MAG: FAD-binding oxidoreductase [Candidatus Nomurabacteria bacterium]|jgi:FAD/FMN-containing dehydrogenase|nr:FAD-binding oxidoreductase [Candidatus Nomurabacteria bacterium]
MGKVEDYLRDKLTGEISTDPAVRADFACDGSILKETPRIVVFPRTTNDVRKVARFTWRLAERGQVLPITARGGGTSTTGAAIGRGAVMSFLAHMSRILELDVKSQMVRVQPGLNFATLQEAMATHGLFLPTVTSDFKAATIGGALASNVAGTKSVKYGTLRDWTYRTEVVLANGEIIQTGRLSKHELNAKKGLQTMEGEIYRGLDALIDENTDAIDNFASGTSLNAGGYAIDLVKSKDGSFDLTPLFVGSQGTLGLITQAIVKLTPRPENVSLIAAAITAEQDLPSLIEQLIALEPSELEFIDGGTLDLIEKKDGGTTWKHICDKRPDTLLFIEFDDKQHVRKAKKAARVLDEAAVVDAQIANNWEDQEILRSIHHSVSVITNFSERGVAALPIAPDLTVAPTQVPELVETIKKLLCRHHIEGGIWGHLGTGIVTVRPLLNLANLGQRQAVFKLINVLLKTVNGMNGLMSGEFGDGRLLAFVAEEQYGEKMVDIFNKVKTIFDPYDTLNPGVITGTTQDDLLSMLRQDYRENRFPGLNLRG